MAVVLGGAQPMLPGADEHGEDADGDTGGTADGGTGEAAGAGRRQRGGRWWRVAASALLVGGIAGAAVGGAEWSAYARSQATGQFRDRAAATTAAISQRFQRSLDLERSFAQLVATADAPTNAVLGPWLASLDIRHTYPGTAGITLVQRVPAGDLGAYEAAVTTDPIPGYGPGPYSVYPPGTRSTYCLSRFGVVLGSTSLPAGIDLCAPTLLGIANPVAGVLDRASATGRPQVFGLSSVVSAAGKALPASMTRTFRNQYLVVLPVYAGGTRPSSSAARQAALLGWALADFDGTAVIDSAISSTRGLSIEVRSGSSVLATVGAVSHQGWPATTTTLAADSGVTVTVAAPPSATPTVEGVAIGLVGALMTLLLFWFAVYLGRSRDWAIRLVEERTEDLRHQALHDALTGLPNRALLFDRADQMLARARRQPHAVGALYIDLDNFKDVNDSYGHNTGDALLKAVATRLQAAVRESDTVGRLGGDEFLVLTEDEEEGSDPDAGPELVAERLIAVLGEPFTLSTPTPVTLQVTLSIGIAAGARASAEDLIRDADVALYQAKEAGKGRYVTFRPEMQMAVQDRLTLEQDLRTAIAEDQLFVLYQPIFDLAGMRTKGVEALVRWRHPTRGIVAPGVFIPIAEQSGLIVQIGRFVLEQSCAQAADWQRRGYQVSMSVNVSVAQLESEGFVEVVRSVLERNRLAPHTLTLEVTESMLMRDPAHTTQLLVSLRQLGVRIAIDDFGTGYSSLAYLRQFPIDSLKIDRSFIAKASQSSQAKTLVRTLVQLGQALQIETLAEGIEERSQLTALQQERCDSGQGFLFARPLPPEELEPFFRQADQDPDGITA